MPNANSCSYGKDIRQIYIYEELTHLQANLGSNYISE